MNHVRPPSALHIIVGVLLVTCTILFEFSDIQGLFALEGPQTFHIQDRDKQWALRSEYNWTQSKEVTFSREALNEIRHGNPSNRDTALLFVGIFCRQEDWMARTLIRQTSIALVPPGMVVKFVICHLKSGGLDPLLWAEMQQHQDLYLIDCVENMNEGKSFRYFTSVRQDFPGFSYYGKTDTDTYVLFHNVARALDASPRCLFYGGLSNGPVNKLSNFISGSFYLLSNDLVVKLETCGQICANTNGAEDVMMAEHLWTLVGGDIQYGDFGSNRTLYYDRQSRDTEIKAQHVLLHPLKAPQEWWNVHMAMVSQMTVKEILRTEEEYFWDGPFTTIRHTC